MLASSVRMGKDPLHWFLTSLWVWNSSQSVSLPCLGAFRGSSHQLLPASASPRLLSVYCPCSFSWRFFLLFGVTHTLIFGLYPGHLTHSEWPWFSPKPSVWADSPWGEVGTASWLTFPLPVMGLCPQSLVLVPGAGRGGLPPLLTLVWAGGGPTGYTHPVGEGSLLQDCGRWPIPLARDVGFFWGFSVVDLPLWVVPGCKLL